MPARNRVKVKARASLEMQIHFPGPGACLSVRVWSFPWFPRWGACGSVGLERKDRAWAVGRRQGITDKLNAFAQAPGHQPQNQPDSEAPASVFSHPG